MKTLYDRLQPKLLINLNSNEPQYADSVARVTKLLIDNNYYGNLTISEVDSIMTFCDVDMSYVSTFMYRYGEQLFVKD
ncbi:unnamed protein product [marine sediment metagenome]|uniref:Uncharacterized protein n=1 Tax=marine sediment metagenome TaxID=412755 RepID=X0T0T3_9ZZZZ